MPARKSRRKRFRIEQQWNDFCRPKPADLTTAHADAVTQHGAQTQQSYAAADPKSDVSLTCFFEKEQTLPNPETNYLN